MHRIAGAAHCRLTGGLVLQAIFAGAREKLGLINNYSLSENVTKNKQASLIIGQ